MWRDVGSAPLDTTTHTKADCRTDAPLGPGTEISHYWMVLQHCKPFYRCRAAVR